MPYELLTEGLFIRLDRGIEHVIPGAELGDPAARVLAQALAQHGVGEQAVDRGTQLLRVAGLYEQAGYYVIEPFGPYVDSEYSICYERVLDVITGDGR